MHSEQQECKQGIVFNRNTKTSFEVVITVIKKIVFKI